MKYILKTFLALTLVLIPIKASYSNTLLKDDKIDFNNVDKKIEGWKYFFNSQELYYLPEIYLNGNTKYLPIEVVRHLGANLNLDLNNRIAYISTNEESFVIKENSKQIYLNNKNYLLSDEVIWKNNTLYAPANFFIRVGGLISENKFKNELNVIKGLNILNDTSINSDTLENKITFNFSFVPNFETEKGKNFYRVTFLGATNRNIEELKKQLENISADFKKVEVENSKIGLLTITFYTKVDYEFVNTYPLYKSNKLVVQFPKIYKYELRELKPEGLYYSKISQGSYFGPQKINLVEVNTSNFTVRPIVAKDETDNFTLKELSRISKDFNPILAINGGFFSTKTKQPLGLVMLNGSLVSPPIYNRSAFIINNDNSFEIKNIDLNVFFKVYNFDGTQKMTKISFYKQSEAKNQLVFLSENATKALFAEEKKLQDKKLEAKEELTTEKNYILLSYIKGEPKLTQITNPEDIVKNAIILYASGTFKDYLNKVLEDKIPVEVAFEYSEPVEKINYALGAGPTLVKNNMVNITSELEKFKPDITEGRAPRTALGFIDNRKLFLLTVDGRQDTSVGMSLEELALFTQKLGLKEVINFDGGGSTTMYYDNDIINSISDPKERKVSTGLFIFKKK